MGGEIRKTFEGMNDPEGCVEINLPGRENTEHKFEEWTKAVRRELRKNGILGGVKNNPVL